MIIEQKTVTLTCPLTDAKGNEIRELTFREPIVGDVVAAEKMGGPNAKIAAIVARQNNLTIPVVETMLARDFKACDRAIGELMGNDQPEAGGTPPGAVREIGLERSRGSA